MSTGSRRNSTKNLQTSAKTLDANGNEANGAHNLDGTTPKTVNVAPADGGPGPLPAACTSPCTVHACPALAAALPSGKVSSQSLLCTPCLLQDVASCRSSALQHVLLHS